MPVLFLKECEDRTIADTLVKAILLVDVANDEVTNEEDAWFDHQLVGLKVIRDAVEIGVVTRVDHLPSQDLLAVETAAGEVLVPFVKAIVPVVDMKNRTLTVTPPLGLFEEVEELQEVESATSVEHITEEIGDLLFAVVNFARFHKVDAEHALKSATAKFDRRFRDMEASAGEAFAGLSLDAKEEFWRQAKAKESK